MAENENTYYTSHKAELLKDFDQVAREVRIVAIARYEQELIDAIIGEARQKFEAMLPRLPYIGGKKNALTKNLYGSAQALAFFKVAQAHGITPAEVGELVYRATEQQLARIPLFITRLMGWMRFNTLSLSKWRKQAEESQQRRYPGDWVFTFVEGNGESFDYGIDYTECGICKFYQSEGSAEFARYLCPLDYPMSQAFGMGMVRTQTIAEGAKTCDFRFKWGRKTRPGWPPLFLKGK